MTIDEPIIIVTGLPRSGTSLMMQMLQAGGVPVLTDGARRADASNPRGYFEYEPVKRLAADNSWLGEARGKALKVIAQLLLFLPRGFPYQFLFMQRDLTEVIQSQMKMTQALHGSAAGDADALASIYARNLEIAGEFITHQPRSTVSAVNFRDLIVQRGATIERIIQFLERPNMDQAAMEAIIDTTLYRSR